MKNWQRHMAQSPDRTQVLNGDAIGSYHGGSIEGVKAESIETLNDPAQTLAGFPKNNGGLA